MNTVQKIRTKKNTPMRLGTRQALIGMSFIAPNFIGFLILTLIPVLFTFILSVCKWDGFNPIEFVGLKISRRYSRPVISCPVFAKRLSILSSLSPLRRSCLLAWRC